MMLLSRTNTKKEKDLWLWGEWNALDPSEDLPSPNAQYVGTSHVAGTGAIGSASAHLMAFFFYFLYYTHLYYFEHSGMSHTIREKSKLLGRVRRIRGQVEALERALDAEKGCAEILHQIAAVRGAINGLMAEVLEEHVRTHIADPAITSDAERTQGADELIGVLRAYIK